MVLVLAAVFSSTSTAKVEYEYEKPRELANRNYKTLETSQLQKAGASPLLQRFQGENGLLNTLCVAIQ
jgi:hypothetical protein